LTSCGLVLALVLVAGSGLSGMHLSVFHVTPPPASGSSKGSSARRAGQVLTGSSLLANLRTVELTSSNTVIFHADSPLPTYWQVGILSVFNGTEWLPDRAAQSALADAPTAAANLAPSDLPAPNNGQLFDASVHLTHFASRLLPAPPHTVSVRGLSGAVAVGQEGVLAQGSDSPHAAYSVTAELPPTQPSSDNQLSLNDPRLAPYLALPSEPAIIPFLAHEVVGRATTQGAEAQDLVNWFRSGIFRYTLDPPALHGADPLVQFLTVTRAGYCQQFAGAFGILARSLGIPTRLVVGFTAGQASTGGGYVVTGADAHVWPQVYLGPGAGWISVEPTPAAADDTVAPAGVVGPTASPVTSGTAPSTTPGTVPTQPGGTGGTGARPRPAASTHPQRKARAAAGSGTGWLWALAVAVLAAAGALVAVVLRRRGKASTGGGTPEQRILRAWEQAQRALRRHGLGRRGAETVGEYAARLDRLAGPGLRQGGAEALAHLVVLVERACYAPTPCTALHVQAAQGWATTVVESTKRR
jgi:transglutaminase-like putative cysteine protease